MDQVMPKLTGLEAIVKIRKVAANAKFIMLTSSSRQDELELARTLNVQKYLLKPINTTALITTIAKSLMADKL